MWGHPEPSLPSHRKGAPKGIIETQGRTSRRGKNRIFSALTEIWSLGLGWEGRVEMGRGAETTLTRTRSLSSQPFSGTNIHKSSRYSLPYEVPVAGVGGLAIPQSHLLMQIVVK